MSEKHSLFSAVESEDLPSVSTLLQDLSQTLDLSALRTRINQRDTQNQTVLHLSCSHLHPDITQILLEAGCDPNVQDSDGRTPTFLLFTRLIDCSCDECTKRCIRCLSILSYHGASLDIPNNSGTTPLSLCASNRFQDCCRALLENGAALGTSNGTAMVEILVEKVPSVLETVFDRAITLPSHQNIHDTNFEVTFDLSTILPPQLTNKSGSTTNLHIFPAQQWFEEKFEPCEEMAFLKELLKYSESDATAYKSLLRHPLVNIFTDVKWKSLESLYISFLILQVTVLIAYTGFILATIFVDCPYDIFMKIGKGIDKISGFNTSEIIDAEQLCEINVISKVISVLVLAVTLLILAKEIQHAVYDLKEYLKDLTNYFQLVGFCSVIYTVIVAWNSRSPMYVLLYPVAAFGITVSWCQLFVQIGRLPQLAIYVEMFVKISINFCTSLAIYSCLLIGFAMSYSILFPEKPRLSSLPLSFIKIMTMLVGEMDHDNLFNDTPTEHNLSTARLLQNDTSFVAQVVSLGNQHRFAGRIWYMMFLIFITLVLMNLLVGLAVSDIQGIRKNAEIFVIKRRIRYIAYLEKSLFEGTAWLPNKIKMFMRENVAIKRSKKDKAAKFMCCFDYLCSPINMKNCKLTIRPNDPTNNRLLSNESKMSIRHWLLSKTISRMSRNCTVNKRSASSTSTNGFRHKNLANFRKSSTTSFVIPQQIFVKDEPSQNITDTERLRRLELNVTQMDKKMNELDLKLEMILKTVLRPNTPITV